VPAPAVVDTPGAAPSITHNEVATAGGASESPSASGGVSHSASTGPNFGGAAVSAAPAAGGSGANGGGGGEGTLALAIPGDGGVGAYGAYLTALRRRLYGLIEYPPAARRRGLTGTVHLEIALEPTGRVSDVVLVRSSEHDVLDRAALEAARSLRRVPFPADVRPRALRVRLPVVFELR
jgi:TonB family protein